MKQKLLLWLLSLCLLGSLTACTLPEPVEDPQTVQTEVQPVDAPADGGMTVHFVDVGQADCALLQCGEEAMLIDGGNVDDSQLVVSYLEKQGVESLSYVVGTHAHEDHIGGLAGVLAVYPTEYVFCPVEQYDTKCFRDFRYYADQQGLELIRPEPGTVWPLGDAEVTFLGPVADYEDTNDTSIVLRVDYGETSFLFTGDAETAAEHDILEAGYDVSADVLKVGHHGSNTSSSYRWLYEVNPRYGVISCETGNDYGHPHEEPLSRLKDAGVQLYRTDLQGHVICSSDGTDVTFETQKNADIPQEEPENDTYYIGNVRSKTLHLPTCENLPEPHNQFRFDELWFALLLQYTPCGSCME